MSTVPFGVQAQGRLRVAAVSMAWFAAHRYNPRTFGVPRP